MTGLEFGLLLIGALLVAASFFMTKKFSDSDIDELKKMSESQIKVILEKQLKEADGVIEAAIDSKMDQKMEELDVRSDKETNNKIKQISEYSDSVLDSMNKSHDEIMFMYDMLNEKQEKTTELIKNLQAMESEIRMLKDAIEAFGADRIMWASDYSVNMLGESWEDILNGIQKNIDFLI